MNNLMNEVTVNDVLQEDSIVNHWNQVHHYQNNHVLHHKVIHLHHLQRVVITIINIIIIIRLEIHSSSIIIINITPPLVTAQMTLPPTLNGMHHQQ
jgi:hypothetical protein